MNNLERIEQQINQLLDRHFRGRLLERGLARSMIWNDGVLPDGAPKFSNSLSYDLLSHGFSLLSLAIQYKELNGNQTLLNEGFRHAGDAITYVIENGDPENYEKGFHRIIAAASYHLAYFSAKAYSLLHNHLNSEDCIVIEKLLAKIILRDFSGLEKEVTEWKIKNLQDLDQQINELKTNTEISEKQIADFILETALDDSYYSALFQFLVAYECADNILVNDSLALLENALSVCSDHGLVRQWWIIRISKHLLNELWLMSFHTVLPTSSPSKNDQEWKNMRWQFISSLMMRGKAEIDLWPSQLEGAKRAVNDHESIVVSLPTSAGKTRIAELCILRCLSIGKRVMFITPLRALSAQTEVSLRKTFSPLGKKVSSLYGSIGISNLEQDVMRTSDIVVGTPEKLDFALRNDASLLDDIGLIVLDEGHMIGLGSREISYEVQIQRLLRRPDAHERRLVCLSAILPEGDQFNDFVNWIQNDSTSNAIQSTWRPTELRFGTINWHKTYSGKASPKDRHGYARINFTLKNQEAFIPRFLESFVSPLSKPRPTPFPKNKAELTIISAYKLIEEGHTVLIYCTQKNFVNSLAKQVIDLDEREALTPKIPIDEEKIASAIALGNEWLGEEHEIIKCLRIGIAVHHGSLPTPFRKEIEKLLREGTLKITISSPTLAQGLNLSATALIMYSLTRFNSDEDVHTVIDIAEFKNVIGRAGRAYVDTHGLVLYPIWPNNTTYLYRGGYYNDSFIWNDLTKFNLINQIESGLLQLIRDIIFIPKRYNFSPDTENDFIQYICNNTEAWPILNLTNKPENSKKFREYVNQISLLDTALLSMLGEFSNTTKASITECLNFVLEKSLAIRNGQKSQWNSIILHVLKLRADYIWDNTTSNQRKGYFFAGIGFDTGKKLDSVANEVNKLLLESNEHIANQNDDKAIESIIELAQIIFEINPFIPKKGLPNEWKKIITSWLLGNNIQEEKFIDLNATLEFIEDGLIYRLPWGLEAIKVRALANEEITTETGEQLDLVVPAIENGTLNKQAAMLMQAGFNSRLAAIFIVESTDAKFQNLTELTSWLNTIAMPMSKLLGYWPAQGLWEEFCRNHTGNVQRNWKTKRLSLTIELINPTSAIQKVKLIQSNNSVILLNTRGDSLNITIPL